MNTPCPPASVTCPWCGAEVQTPGQNCQICDRLISELPAWAIAEAQPRNALLRTLRSRRGRLTSLGALVFILGFVFWLSIPFVPDPVVLLFKKPTSDLTSASLPGQWSSVAWDLGGTRNIEGFSRQPNGRILWSKNLGKHTYGAPIVVDGIIYAGGDFEAIALEAETGEIIWEVPTPGRMNHSFAVSDSYLYMGLSDHRLLALNGNLRSSPAISEGYLYATDSDGNLNILNARTGQTRFRFRTSAPASDAPAVGNGLAYFPSGGRLFAVDAGARTVWGEFEFKKVWSQFYIWQFPGVPRPPTQRGERWRFAPEKMASRGIIASPAVTPEALYYGDANGYFYARGVPDRENLWRFRAEGSISSSPVILGDRLYFGDQDGFFYSLERSTGKLDWRLFLDAPIEVSPVFAGDRFYVRTNDGWLHVID